MYILELTNGFPFSENPMLGCFEFDQAKALASIGNKVVMLSLDLRSILRKRKYGLQVFEQNGVKVYNYAFPVGNVPNFIIAFLSVFFAKKIYKKILKNEGKPDILHAHFCFLQGYFGAKLKEKYNIPLVITEHSSELIHDFDESRKKYFIYGYSKANRVIAVGTALQRNIKERFGIDSIVVPNIVSLDEFSYREKTNLADGIFPYIAVGSAIYGKGFDVVLKAFAKLNEPKSRLIIVGDGAEREKLELLAKKLGIHNQVDFKGLLPREEISPLIQQSKVFILTSRYETFGIVYIEAMATGTPVIATRCGGPEDIVTSENGILVNVDDVDETASAMRKMMDKYTKYDKKMISENAIKLYSQETIGNQIQSILNKIKLI